MTPFPYRLVGPIGSAGTLGLIVLQTDETIEQEFRWLFPGRDVALHVSRIPSGAEITPETIAEMEVDLPRAVDLLPHPARFDVTGYACTSGTTLIGAERVAALVSAHCTTRAVTNPLSAAFAAFEALRARSLAIVSPYVASVADAMRDAFRGQGFAVPATLSFGEKVEERVARIDPGSILEAALDVGNRPDVDAVFLSCTNLRTLDIIDTLEERLSRPVVSSNLALAWHMARLSGAPVAPDAPGRLMRV